MFARVMVDIAHANVDRTFTYAVPEGLFVQPGHHVMIPFGRGNRPKEGFVVAISECAYTGAPLKEMIRVIEPYPILLPDQLLLAEWIRTNYNCLLIDALRLMIPSKLRGGHVHEKITRTVRLSPSLSREDALSALLDASGKPRAKKQYEVLSLVSDCGAPMSVSDVSAFIPGANAAITALIQKGLLCEEGQVTFRTPMANAVSVDKPVALNDAQRAACEAVSRGMQSGGGVFMLHGVTGSGKTEVYMHAIRACLSLGKRAILLVPEIALTPQAVGLFRARFGDGVAVLHSRLSDGERFDEWRRIRLSKADVVIGARSAIFAPVTNLGLIVVDEEHEPSYQSESTPRYSALDVSIKRAALTNAALLLGSATPSLLSYYRAISGRYTLLTLPERVQKRPLPTVEVVDMRAEFLSGNNGIFSQRLIALLEECFRAGHQAMLFLNRRGYSTFVSCRACGHVIQCENCDLSMTYHKSDGNLSCHFCGATTPLPRTCPVCGKPFIRYFGVGTEQVEEQAKSLFPDVSIIRLDTDTVRGKNDLPEKLGAFAENRAQLLIGTQMIAKGHDFPNVTLVGVVAADSTLRFPDYRSTERTFQLLTQVAGRAGRDESPGRVVIQTYSPEHPAIQFAKKHDYEGFFRYELSQRQKALFPPYSLFLRILFTGSDENLLSAQGERFSQLLRTALSELLGPDAARDLLLLSPSPAPVKRKNRDFRYQVLIKLLRTKNTARAIRFLYAFTKENGGDLVASVEVNPQDML